MRRIKLIKTRGRRVKASLDFRAEKEIVIIDEKFVSNSWMIKHHS